MRELMTISKLIKPKNAKNIFVFQFLYIFKFSNLQSLAEKSGKPKNREVLWVFNFCPLRFGTALEYFHLAQYSNMLWELIWEEDNSENCPSIMKIFQKVQQHENSSGQFPIFITQKLHINEELLHLSYLWTLNALDALSSVKFPSSFAGQLL